MQEDLTKLSLLELRQIWADTWKKQPSERLGRAMLEKSLAFKLESTFTHDQQSRLEKLIKSYKQNPKDFDKRCSALKPGTQLIRCWKGRKRVVLIKANGFDYQGRLYTSLSQIANDITGTRWNGLVFFGLKRKDST